MTGRSALDISVTTDTVNDDMLLVLTPLLFGLSLLSGMLDLGVAFIAIPVLGLFAFVHTLRFSRPSVRIGFAPASVERHVH